MFAIMTEISQTMNGLCIMTNMKRFLFDVIGIYIIWICLHYISANLYPYFCTQYTLWGFLIAPFLTVAPHCQAMRWIIYTGGNNIVGMWSVIGTLLMKKLVVG